MLKQLLEATGARALIFDMDGTIVDNMRVHEQVWCEWAEKEGLKHCSDDEFIPQIHGTIRDVMRRLCPDRSEEERLELGERKEAYFREIYGPQMRLIDGLEKVLCEAAALQIPVALATAGQWSNINFTLDGCAVREYFSVIVGADDVTHGKPDPEVFLRAAEKLGVPSPECLVFEDSIIGVEAARRAAM
jgi:HAD superfamily hydrolase (TIGR01509 family)